MGKRAESDIFRYSLRQLLKPIMRYCLRRSLKLQEILEASKAALIEVAEEELSALGERGTVNRLSIMTGLHRADVARLQALGEDAPGDHASNVINRLIAQWQSDKRFLTEGKKPRVLSFDGKQGDFAKLVRSISADPNPYSLLTELLRIGAVEHTSKGIRLTTPEYIVRSDPKKSFEHLSQDCEDLISAVEENIFTHSGVPHLHLRTEYDNIPQEFLPTIRKWLLQEGSAFHKRVGAFLSRYDRDTNKKLPRDGESARVVLGSYSKSEK